MMNRLLLLGALWCVSSASMAAIGMVETHYQDPIRHRDLETRILFPTASTEKESTVAENVAFYGFKAVDSATPHGHNLPLYVLAHGTSGNWKNLSWLGSQLAEQGAVVVSANHPGYTTGQATPESIIRMWEQPRDVSFLLDKVLASDYGQYIDNNHITVIGHSLGGYTALALAGARLDMTGYQAYCRQHSDRSCHYFHDVFAGLSQHDRLMIAGDYRDKRVTKAIAIAPGYVPAILPQSLANLSAKTLIIGGEFDKTIPPKLQIIPYIKTNLKSLTYHEIQGASHFSFLQDCKPQAIKILAEEGAAFVCQEAADRDRASLHQEVLEQVTQ